MAQTKLPEEIDTKDPKNADVIIWASETLEDGSRGTTMSVMTSRKKLNIEPHELGYKYNIFHFRTVENFEETSELYSAILGDPRGYVERMGAAGYHGIIVKANALRTKKEIKALLSKILSSWGFSESGTKRIVREALS